MKKLSFVLGVMVLGGLFYLMSNQLWVGKSDLSSIDNSPVEWPHYGRDGGHQRFSPLTQIKAVNLSRLKKAWVHYHGDFSDGTLKSDIDKNEHLTPSAAEAAPLYLRYLKDEQEVGFIYYVTPFNRVLKLDPVNGKEVASYDPEVVKMDLNVEPQHQKFYFMLLSRGIESYRPKSEGAIEEAKKESNCKGLRLFLATLDARLIALDADTLLPCVGFGEDGIITVNKSPSGEMVTYMFTSPPAVIGDTVVLGSRVADNLKAKEESGVVRAYDTITGEKLWEWDPIPEDLRTKSGAANVWSFISVDPKNNLIFLPTSSPSPDYYGGLRPENNEWANSIVAIKVSPNYEDGKNRKRYSIQWSHQLVHHDLWDYDLPAAPILSTLSQSDGSSLDIVTVLTKMGFIFVFNRIDGTPLTKIKEVKTGAGSKKIENLMARGEKMSESQPFPPERYQLLTTKLQKKDYESILGSLGFLRFDSWAKETCVEQFKKYQYQGIFTPPTLRTEASLGSMIYPGYMGGMNWTGGTLIGETLIVPVNNIPTWLSLIDKDPAGKTSKADAVAVKPMEGVGYSAQRSIFKDFMGDKKLGPCSPGPFAQLVAIRLSQECLETAKPDTTYERVTDLLENDSCILWKKPLGWAVPGPKAALLSSEVGSPIIGGGIATKSNLYFIASTNDKFLRALDTNTGKQLWMAKLEFPGIASPITFEHIDKNQYVVIGAGGHAKMNKNDSNKDKMDQVLGDAVIAFRLCNEGICPTIPVYGTRKRLFNPNLPE